METNTSHGQSRTPVGGWTSSLFRKRSHRGESPSGFTPHGRESKRFKFNSRKSYSRSLTCLSSQVKGQLKVAVYKNTSRVLVDVLEASFECVNHNLSTYVQISLETRDEVLVKKFTQLQKKNNKPAYKEVFWFSLSELQPGRRIVLSVFESVQKSSIFIGSMSFGVKHILTNNKASYGWFYLLEAETGRKKHLAVPSQPDTTALQDMNGREKQKNNILPRIKVFNVMLSRDHRGKYGFKFQNTLPASVGKVQPGGPAALAGMKEGDTFLELDGFNVAGASAELISTILKQSTGYVTALLQRTAECMSPMPNVSQPKKKRTPLSRGSFNLFYRTSTGGRKYISSPGLSSPMQRASLSNRKKLDKGRVLRMSPYTPLLHRRLKRELAAKVAQRQSQMNLKGMGPNDGGATQGDVADATKTIEVSNMINSDLELREKLQFDGDSSEGQPTQRQASVDAGDRLERPQVSEKERVPVDSLNADSYARNEERFAGDLTSQGEPTTSQDEVHVGAPLLLVTMTGGEQGSEVDLPTGQREASSSDVPESTHNITKEDTDHDDEGKVSEESHIHREMNAGDTDLTEGEQLSKDVNELVERNCREDNELKPDAGNLAEENCLQENGRMTSSSAISETELKLTQTLQAPLHAVKATDETPDHSTNASPMGSDKGTQSSGPRAKVNEELTNGSSVSFVDGVEPFPLSTPARDFIHVDRLLIQREGKRLQKLVVLLLSDIVVFGKLSASGHFKIIYDPLHLDDISWLDSDCKKVSEFRILLLTSKHPLSSRGGSISFTAPSQTCKRIWMRHLQERLMVVKYQGLKKRSSSERNLIPMESKEEDLHHHHQQQQEKKKQRDPSEKTGSPPRDEDGCSSPKYSTCAMESNNNSNSESNHYSRLLSELSGDEDDMPSMKCNGPTTGLMDQETSLALPHLEVEGTAEKWSEGLRMPSSSAASSQQVRTDDPRTRESPSDEEEASSSGEGEGEEEGQNSFSHTNFSSPVSHSHSNSCQLVQSTQSTPTVSHRESFKRAKSAPSISPNSPMACLAVKHPEKKLVRRQSSPPGALKENNSVSIRSKFRKTIFRRFTGTHRDENNVQSVTRDNKKDMKKTKRGFHTFSSSPQLNIRLSDNNSSSLQRIPNEEMVVGNDVETRSLQDQPIRKTKSIAKEIKAKVQFLRRRHTEGSLQETEENVNPATKTGPDLEDIRRWADGFESLLKDEFGLEAFRKFLQTEFSDENIEFWLACEEYKDLKPSKMVARAHKIYEDYVTIQAPREVNLDSRTRLQVVSNLSHPNKHSFEQAQKRIEALMEKDSYPRFLRSDIYIKLQKAAKKNK